MLSYGYREAIVNSTKTLKHTFDGTKVTIEGFGILDNSKIKYAKAHRAKAPVMSTATVTVPAAADLGIGATEKNVPVSFEIHTKSFSYDAENASDSIGHGLLDPVGIVVDGSDTGATIAGKVRAAYQALKDMYPGDVYKAFEVTGATDKVIFTGTTGSIYFSDKVYMEADNKEYPVKLTSVNVIGTEGRGQGKQLEESVRMSTGRNDKQYSVTPNEIPDVTAEYTEITLAMASPVGGASGWAGHENEAGNVPGSDSPSTTQRFVIYYKEDGDLFAGDGTVDQMIQWILASSNVTTADVIKADDTAVTGADAAAQADAFIA